MAVEPSGGTVLVLRGLGLGDALTALPALRGLRRAHPGARLVLAAPPVIGEWLRGLGVVDEVAAATGPRLRWAGPRPDVAVNLHGRGPQSHLALLSLRPGRLVAFACPGAGHLAGPTWPSGSHEVDRWCSLVRDAGGACGPEDLRLPHPGVPEPASTGHVVIHPGVPEPASTGHVVIHPGAASRSRRWPVDRWIALASHLVGSGHRVVVTGSAGEADLCAAVARAGRGIDDLAGQLDLDELVQVVGTARLLVCGDTGVAHVGTATGTPSVLLFGPVSPLVWGPRIDTERHVVLWRPEPDDPPGDPHGTTIDPRLDRLALDDVVAAVDELLARVPARRQSGSSASARRSETSGARSSVR